MSDILQHVRFYHKHYSDIVVFKLNFNKKLTHNDMLQLMIKRPNLDEIHFNRRYNQPLPIGIFDDVNFTSKIKEIHFGNEFNQPLELGVFHEGIGRIVFGRDFNQPIPIGIFPDSLISIEFSDKFNQPISEELFPTSIAFIRYGIHTFTMVKDFILIYTNINK